MGLLGAGAAAGMGIAVATSAARVSAVQALVRRGGGPAKAGRPRFAHEPHGWRERGRLDAAAMALVGLGEVGVGLSNAGMVAAVARRLVSADKSLRYGTEHPRQVMTVVMPRSAGRGGPPCVVLVHGGAWCWGERFQYGPAAETLAAALGCPVCVPSYRSYPHGDAVMMALDVRDAIARAAAEFGRGVLVVGHSAGASLALAAVALGAGWTARAEDTDLGAGAPGPTPRQAGHWRADVARAGRVSGAWADGTAGRLVWLSGVADIGEHYRHEASREAALPLVGAVRGVERLSPMAPATGGPRAWHVASPSAVLRSMTHAVARRMPPVDVAHGDSDGVVPASGSLALVQLALSRGVAATLHVLPGLDHPDTLLPLMHAGYDRHGGSARRRVLGIITGDARPSRL